MQVTIGGEAAETGKHDAEVPATCQLQHAAFNSRFWNAPTVETNNNCYNYAMNYRSNTFAQPGQDYHWYRYHSNGFWGQKPGNTAARNRDNSGRVIGGGLNPQNCNRGPYTVFCGYRYSPVGMKVS